MLLFAGPSRGACFYAPVAQLDRVSVFGTEGCGFESLRAHHKLTHTHMAGEIIKALTVGDAEKQILAIYHSQSITLDMITREEYEAYEESEREDSDNHLNIERLGKDTKIVDLAYYKYLPERKTAYRIDLVDENQKLEKQLFFVTLPRE